MDPEERDRRLIAAGEPAWGDVEPGTTSVTYWLAQPSPTEAILFRIVAEVEHGPFYFESYSGNGRWEVDGRGFTYVGHAPGDSPKYVQLTGRQASQVMMSQDAGGPVRPSLP
jgi:hypothetical protein